jgi:hypothetical protein
MRRNKLKKTTVIGAATTTATKATKKLLNQIIKLSRNYGAGVHPSDITVAADWTILRFDTQRHIVVQELDLVDFDPTHDLWAGGGKSADDLVPAVDPADLRNVLSVLRTLDSKVAAIGMSVFEHVCSPGADTRAVWYRAAMLTLPTGAGLLSHWVHNGEFDDAVLKVAAKFPMKKLNVGVVHQGLPFDAEEFVKQVEEAAI